MYSRITKTKNLRSAPCTMIQVDKRYLAIVHGNVAHDQTTINEPIGRHSLQRELMCVKPHGDKTGKTAKTICRVRERYGQYTLVCRMWCVLCVVLVYMCVCVCVYICACVSVNVDVEIMFDIEMCVRARVCVRASACVLPAPSMCACVLLRACFQHRAPQQLMHLRAGGRAVQAGRAAADDGPDAPNPRTPLAPWPSNSRGFSVRGKECEPAGPGAGQRGGRGRRSPGLCGGRACGGDHGAVAAGVARHENQFQSPDREEADESRRAALQGTSLSARYDGPEA